MRDLEKSALVRRLCEAVINAAECYENDSEPIYFDYDSVIHLLEQAQTLVIESARCPRPSNLPPNLPWRERLYNGDEVIDPYAFDGTMRVEDYDKMHDLMTLDRESPGEDDAPDEDDFSGMTMQ
jgi:hypothetical protein